MAMVVCPHCKAHRIVTSKVPKDVVVVLPCPSCHELSVLFRDRLVPIDRHLLETGTHEARVEHLAKIIAEFLDGAIGPLFEQDGPGHAGPAEAPDFSGNADGLDAFLGEDLTPISDKEFSKFVRIDLKCLDNPAYFKRHFG